MKSVPNDCIGLCTEKWEEKISRLDVERKFISVCDEWRESIKKCGGANWNTSNFKYKHYPKISRVS